MNFFHAQANLFNLMRSRIQKIIINNPFNPWRLRPNLRHLCNLRFQKIYQSKSVSSVKSVVYKNLKSASSAQSAVPKMSVRIIIIFHYRVRLTSLQVCSATDKIISAMPQ